jgi:hypothetical protein
MAPTQSEASGLKEPDTIRCTRFFNAFDNASPQKSLAAVRYGDDIAIAPSTGRKWVAFLQPINHFS